MSDDPGLDYRRDTCLWLSELATWRPGLIGTLCTEKDRLDTVLRHSRQEIAAQLAPKRRARTACDSESDGALFRAALRRGGPAEARKSAGAYALTFVDDGYPAVLRQLHDPPPALYVCAAAAESIVTSRLRILAEAPKIAIVGSRSCSGYGLEMASGLAADLAARGAVVVSGMAMGADAAAHRGALRGVRGLQMPLPTVAVLGCGADVIYPKTNGAVRTSVARRGLILSEFVWGTAARSWRFPSRNRIMAALCHAVVVVEGSTRSGALITARQAEDMDRQLFAVPGEAGRRLSMGPHELIKKHNARLCECADDVISWFEEEQEKPDPVALRYLRDREDDAARTRPPARIPDWCLDEKTARAVIERLDEGPVTADELCERLHTPLPAIMALLSALELQGLARPEGGGSFRAVRGG